MTDRKDRDRDLSSSAHGDDLTGYEAEADGDLTAIQADDALLDALGGTDPTVADGLGDQELNALLLAWRRDIDSEPLGELVDADTAVRTVKSAASARKYSSRGRRRRVFVPVAAACAAAAIAFTGTGLAARDAQPGDTLWGLTKVLYADHARSVEAAAAAKLDLEKANLALADNRLADARRALADAQAALTQVAESDNRDQLLQQHRQLAQQLGVPTTSPTGNKPSVPPSIPPVDNPASSAAHQPQPGQPSSLPATGTKVPDPSMTPPPPVTSTPSSSAPSTSATANDPGGSPRNETSQGAGVPNGTSSGS
ncbi:anti-sigma-D factor RsdA [Amycolatopsis benzoatilytica]|uniref:anti-sigma-D factor RsdA n=1 Tax=Amycolatopsis benzoatilytica TaxID=346045 RepID=UPI0003754654|nr:anti-sigma-D factor RsdA [Amycolatopsis benzoatilytica]